MKSKLVVFIIYPGVTLLDATGPAQVFSTANNEMPEGAVPYRVEIASANGGLIETDTGIKLETQAISEFSKCSIDTLIVTGGNGVFDASQDPQMIDWLCEQIPKARRTISTCMGVFLIAETGLLVDKEVTTHWKWCDALQAKHPELTVLSEPIYIKTHDYASSAGVASGIDLRFVVS